MLFSAHLADTSVLASLRRKAPKPDDVPGLLGCRNAACAPFTPGVLPRPQLSRECLLAAWEDEASLDAFLETNPTGQVFTDGWQARMELVRAVGVWPGLDHDMVAEAGDKARGITGPLIAVTIGTAYVRTIVPFTRVNNGLEDQFLDTPGGIWGTLMTNLPQRTVATLTIWEDSKAALDYMRSGAHGQAVRDHYDPAKDPTGHTFVTGGGFFGFRPLATSGSVAGRNPLPQNLLSL